MCVCKVCTSVVVHVCVCLWGPFRCTWENGHVNYRTTFPVLRADRRTLLPSSFYITLALLTCSHNMHIVYPDNTRLQIHTHIRVCNAYISTNVLYTSVAIFPSINIDQSHRQTRTFITVHIICMTTHAVHSFLVGIFVRGTTWRLVIIGPVGAVFHDGKSVERLNGTPYDRPRWRCNYPE